MAFRGADTDPDKNLSEFQRNRLNLSEKLRNSKMDLVWNERNTPGGAGGGGDNDTDSEISDSDNFLTKGAFLLTPSHELSMDRAAMICDKMNFRGCFSIVKTATGILFKFSHPEDYQAVYRKGFHKVQVTGGRLHKKVIIPCRPQKTFVLYVFDVPIELPEEDIRHSLYRFSSIVEVVRLLPTKKSSSTAPENAPNYSPSLSAKTQNLNLSGKHEESEQAPPPPVTPNSLLKDINPPPVRITLASLEEFHTLLQNGLDFYGATFFPTEIHLPGQTPTSAARLAAKRGRLLDGNSGCVREMLPVFDAAGFSKIPPPSSKTIKPRP